MKYVVSSTRSSAATNPRFSMSSAFRLPSKTVARIVGAHFCKQFRQDELIGIVEDSAYVRMAYRLDLNWLDSGRFL